MQYPHLKLPPYWGGFQRLVDDIHAEMTGKTPATDAKPVMTKAIRTDADAQAFWKPAKTPKVALMIKATPPDRAAIKRAAQTKLAGALDLAIRCQSRGLGAPYQASPGNPY